MLQNKKKAMLTVNLVTYNHEKWIGECLDSILAQKTNFNFIIRIFDDCSTDKTSEICSEYAKKYPEQIELHFSETNVGITENCLRTYQNIKTPYYIYIEGDDYICNNKRFQMQVDALEKHKDCSFCVGMTEERTSDTQTLVGLTPILPKEGVVTLAYIKKHPEKHIFSYLLSRVVRTDCIKIDNDIKNRDFYLLDVTQIYELLKQGNMYYIKKVFGVYRHTGSGIVSGLSKFDRIKFIFDYCYNYNQYTNGEFYQNLVLYLNRCLPYFCFYNKKINRFINLVQKIKRYFIPRFLLDILCIPRDICRIIKKKGRYYE